MLFPDLLPPTLNTRSKIGPSYSTSYSPPILARKILSQPHLLCTRPLNASASVLECSIVGSQKYLKTFRHRRFCLLSSLRVVPVAIAPRRVGPFLLTIVLVGQNKGRGNPTHHPATHSPQYRSSSPESPNTAQAENPKTSTNLFF